MRIGFVSDDLYPGFGGQARASEGHIRVLVDLGHEVQALAGREARPSEPPDVSVVRLPAFRPGATQVHFAAPSPAAVTRLVRWADIVQVNTPTALAALVCLVARRQRVPVVIGFHTQVEGATNYFTRGARLVGWALRRWYRYLYTLPACLTAPTPFAARIASDLTRRPVHVVSNGIKLPTIDDADLREASRLHDSFGRTHLLAYVGRMAPDKGTMGLVELMAHLPADTALAVAGTGPLMEPMRARARALGIADRIHFLGYAPEPTKDALLLAADVFVMPSPTELQSLATLEAMARGCAVFAASFDTSAVPELVRETGGGDLYDPQRPEEAAKALGSLLRDRERLLALQQRATAAARSHDIAACGRKLAHLYTSLLQTDAHACPAAGAHPPAS